LSRTGSTGLLLTVFLVTACRAEEHRWPFPKVAAGDDAAVAAVLAERTAGVDSLYALLSMSFESRERETVLEAVVSYKRPGRIRCSAFKDVVVSTRDAFDLLLTPDTCALVSREPARTESFVGSAAELELRYPGFRGLMALREAVFLPGLLAAAPPPRISRQRGRLRVDTVSPSGSPLVWYLDRATLGVEKAEVMVAGQRIEVAYRAHVERDGRFFPAAFELRDPWAGVTVSGVLEDLEVNPDLPDETFVTPSTEP